MIRPTGVNILVRLSPRREGRGILLIPDKAKRWQESTVEAEVMAVGPSVKSVSPGEIVVIAGHGGRWIDPGITGDRTEIFRMIARSDILLVVDPCEKTELQEAV